MIDAVLFFGVVLSGLLAAMCLMIGKLLFDMSGNGRERSNVYMLKVCQNGDIKIKRYRGNIKHWTELDENNR